MVHIIQLIVGLLAQRIKALCCQSVVKLSTVFHHTFGLTAKWNQYYEKFKAAKSDC